MAANSASNITVSDISGGGGVRVKDIKNVRLQEDMATH